jgi:hypothetical protein
MISPLAVGRPFSSIPYQEAPPCWTVPVKGGGDVGVLGDDLRPPQADATTTRAKSRILLIFSCIIPTSVSAGLGDPAESRNGMKSSSNKDDERLELRVLESDTKNLHLFDRSDLVFAVFYGVLFLWGLILTLISI